MLDKVIFFFFAGVAILGAGLMVTRRNAIHSAVFLITTLMATAGIFLQLRAEFIFIAQIILYVGGIMVLFIFVIMLVRLDVALHQIQFSRQKWVALFVTLALAAEVGVMLSRRVLVFAEDQRLHLPVYVAALYAAALPLRPVNALGLVHSDSAGDCERTGRGRRHDSGNGIWLEPLAGDDCNYDNHSGRSVFPDAFERQKSSSGFFGGAATGRTFD